MYNPYPKKDSYVLRLFGPKDPIIEGFRAVLMRRVDVCT